MLELLHLSLQVTLTENHKSSALSVMLDGCVVSAHALQICHITLIKYSDQK